MNVIKNEEKVSTWFELEQEVDEMNKLKSLLFCMSMATMVEENGSTFELMKMTPALFLAQDLVESTQERLSVLQDIERQNAMKLKEGVVA